jgi:hypothetical protein
VEEVEASMVAAAIRLSLQEAGSSSPAAQPHQLGPTGPASRLSLQEAGSSSPAAQPHQLGPTGPASLKTVRDTPALRGAITDCQQNAAANMVLCPGFLAP